MIMIDLVISSSKNGYICGLCVTVTYKKTILHIGMKNSPF